MSRMSLLVIAGLMVFATGCTKITCNCPCSGADPVDVGLCLPAPYATEAILDQAANGLSQASALGCADSGGTPGTPCSCFVDQNVSPTECSLPSIPAP